MWYHRFVSWIRSLFIVPGRATPDSEPLPIRGADLTSMPWTAPMRGPRSATGPHPALPPFVEFPPRREPPTTVPLGRRAGSSQPLTGSPLRDPISGPLAGPARSGWDGRDLAPPSQPLRASQPSRPQPDPLPPDVPVWPDPVTEPDLFASEGDERDDEPPAIEPGSELYRRLMALRRLVRQQIYNEGFPPDAIPEQYKTYGGGESDDPFSNPFDE